MLTARYYMSFLCHILSSPSNNAALSFLSALTFWPSTLTALGPAAAQRTSPIMIEHACVAFLEQPVHQGRQCLFASCV